MAIKRNRMLMRLFDVQQQQNNKVIYHYSALFGTEVISEETIKVRTIFVYKIWNFTQEDTPQKRLHQII